MHQMTLCYKKPPKSGFLLYKVSILRIRSAPPPNLLRSEKFAMFAIAGKASIPTMLGRFMNLPNRD